MTPPTPRTRGEELLLARISAAAGRAHLGRRLATYAAAAYRPHGRNGLFRAIRYLPALVRYGRSDAARAGAGARLDLYERGMTVAVKGRIHVVRYDTTAVFPRRTRPPHDASGPGATRTYTLIDVDRKRIVLQGRPGHGDAEAWEREIRRAVTHAQLPPALAALDSGERIDFGDIWLTSERIGSGETSMPWSQVRRIGRGEEPVVITIDGKRHRLGPMVSNIPNPFVFWAVVERLRADGRTDRP
ncbi:DUF6585 family protein [Streptomyces sp. NPDC020883]|uniref:DUF6585 family protein n=1 Tax=Streptomyces sp. NPDC020883 TaxID=3365099 RepID=UPI0037AD88C6